MTAIIGVLNKTTVALAADSAATITGLKGDKIYNNAHKIFNISPVAPVGAMVYNSSALMGIPWETIIKMYRQQLGRTTYEELEQYADDLLTYLEKFKKYITPEDELNAIAGVALNLSEKAWNTVDTVLTKQYGQEGLSTFNEEDLHSILTKNLVEIVDFAVQSTEEHNIIPGLEQYTFRDFYNKYAKELQSHIRHFFALKGYSISRIVLYDLIRFTYNDIIRLAIHDHWTGLVITGFGEANLFPKLRTYRIGPVINGIILSRETDQCAIGNQQRSYIAAYAQTDVIDTFLDGIDPDLYETVTDELDHAINSFEDQILSAIPTELKEPIQRIIDDRKPALIGDFRDRVDKAKVKYGRQPINQAIELLYKEDLAEMAESMINLTYLKRRVSFGQESVGGPIDVAIITKGEGFIWLKRKLYFKPELNLNYVGSVLNRPVNSLNNPLNHESSPQ